MIVMKMKLKWEKLEAQKGLNKAEKKELEIETETERWPINGM